MSTHDRQSHLTVAFTRGQSRITSWRSVNPLRLLNPRHDGLCHVMVSSYGGGLVQGDDVSLDVRCEQSAALLLSGQSHGRAYRCTQEDATVSWQTTGTVAEGATVISQMPPLVLHSATRAAQRQSWQVHPEGRLLLIETVHAGRLGSGEAFAFDRFESHVEIQRGATQVVWDPQALPADTPPRVPISGAADDLCDRLARLTAGDPCHRDQAGRGHPAQRARGRDAGGIGRKLRPASGWIHRPAGCELRKTRGGDR